MAAYGATKSNLYGIEVLNEPNNYTIDMHDWLNDYYNSAIIAARQHLPSTTPLMVFSWTYDFNRWPDNAFASHGMVIFDTHIYHV